ncbi:MAG: radical SAM family heme chaperone HemW [Deltaproteobacteria bacterium]|jgi:oxygen-independent coproporphyrinogen-3 oxidase|nr:radical SAM family heme chaperone HemW [Deltaproteobacteria bacterium]
MLPGLYVHVPFCARKCPYCDVYSVSAVSLIPLWLEGLAREAALRAGDWPGPFETVYIGGGTPSLLSPFDLAALFAAISPLKLAPGYEMTIEANPENVSVERVRTWLDFGVNRISLGVQSFDPRWLNESLSRGHTVGDNMGAADAVASTGASLSLDMIFGHPGQQPEEWASDLDKAAATWADHVSAYCLTPGPGTPMGRALAAGVASKLPGEKLASELFLVAGEALGMRGFTRYEVSNFARGGAVCRHNLKYWRREPYLGLGPSAHSFDGRGRWSNTSSVRRWAAALGRGEHSLEFSEELTERQRRMEQVMLGLRLAEGFPAGLTEHPDKLAELEEGGFLTLSDDMVRPTPKGLLAADALAKILA